MPTLADQIAPKPQQPSGLGGWLASIGDEMAGAFARYGRRSGAQRDASLELLNQASAPGTDPIMGAGQKLLGLAGLITHPLAFFPTGDEWRERLSNAGNTGRMGQAIGGMLGDLPSIVDPHLLAGGGALAAAPLVGKLAKPGVATAASEVVSLAQPSNLFKWRDELWGGVKEGRTFKDEPALWRAMSKEEFDALMNDGVLKPRPGAEGAIYVTDDADRVSTPGGSYGAKTSGGVIVRIKKSDTVPLTSRNVRGLDEIGVPQISRDDVTGVWDAKSGDLLDLLSPETAQIVKDKAPAMKIQTLQDARAAHSRAAEIAQEMGFKPAERSDAFTGSSYQDFTVYAKDGKILGPDDPRGPGTKYVSFRIRSADHPEPPSRINNGFGADFSFEPAGQFDEQAFREILQSKLDKATKK